MLTILFLLINVVYAKSLNKDFYHQGKEHHRINENFYHENFRPFIDQVGIKKNEKVISIPDHTPNASLYSIGRYGWSDYNYLKDTFSINNAIRKGAKYLIISNAMMLSSPLIENYTANYVGNFENIFIYKIDLNSKNLRNRFVKLKTKDNYYISWFDDNAADLQITDATTAKQFYMIDIGDGTIAFKINTGRFIASNKETYGKLFINTEWMGDWETFTKIEIEPNKYALKTREGKFLRLNKENNFIGTADNYSEEIILIE